jgi:tetratricopeptide (TPR) repeat protein
MRRRPGARVLTAVLAPMAIFAATAIVAVAVAVAAPAGPDSTRKVNSYGITLALNHQLEQAETAFLSQLSLSPGDAAALNNIGNVYFLRGDAEVAGVFYDRALAADSLEAGVSLNKSIALLALGDEAGAHRAAARGIQLAGGETKAAALLGLKPESGAAERAAEGGGMTATSIRTLLARAAREVPAPPARTDSVRAVPVPTKPKSPKAYRSAGPRADESTGVPAALYWMR